MGYGVLGVGAIGAAIVTGLCDDVDDAPRVLLSPRNAEITAGLARRFAAAEVARRQPGGRRRRAGRDRVRTSAGSRRPCSPNSASPPTGPSISAMAGVPVKTLQPLVAPATDVARAIPLPAGSAARRHHAGPSAERRGHGAVRSTGRDGRARRRQGIRSVLGLDGDDRRALRLPEHASPPGSSRRRSPRPRRDATSRRCSRGSPRRREAGRASSSWRASTPPQAGSTSSF